MNEDEFLQSGLIEAYCLGLASEEEYQLVHEYSARFSRVQSEIESLDETLANLSFRFSQMPPVHLKDKILNRLSKLPIQSEIPPEINSSSTVEEWLGYLERNQIHTPENLNFAEIREIDVREGITTYIAWANKGAVVDEIHSNETEYLFMLSGSCTITFNNKIHYYKKGDFVVVPSNTYHVAEATSVELMILIGQRKITSS